MLAQSPLVLTCMPAKKIEDAKKPKILLPDSKKTPCLVVSSSKIGATIMVNKPKIIIEKGVL